MYTSNLINSVIHQTKNKLNCIIIRYYLFSTVLRAIRFQRVLCSEPQLLYAGHVRRIACVRLAGASQKSQLAQLTGRGPRATDRCQDRLQELVSLSVTDNFRPAPAPPHTMFLLSQLSCSCVFERKRVATVQQTVSYDAHCPDICWVRVVRTCGA